MSYGTHFTEAGITPLHILTTDRFVLRPITADDAEIDHAAVMESKDYLRVWEQSGWPTDDFTVAENREDLLGLQQRHDEGVAFTYTVLDPDDVTHCLGCVYVMPPDARSIATLEITPADGGRWEDVDAAVYFWVRRSALASEGDLLAVLRSWFADAWRLPCTVYVTHSGFTQQVSTIERTDLRLAFRLSTPTTSGDYLAYA